MLCYCCRWAKPPAHPKTVHAHLTMNRLKTRPIFLRAVSGLLGQMHKSFKVSGRNCRTCHNTCNDALIGSLCLICDELTVFSTNINLKICIRHNIEIIDCSRVFSFARKGCATHNMMQHCSHIDASRNSKRARNHVTEFHQTEKKPTSHF